METEESDLNAPVHRHCSHAEHTPGPWEVREHQGLFAIAHPSGWVLESGDVRQDRADAKLIAAAPDLLQACCEMLKAMKRYGCDVDDPPTEQHKQIMLLAMSAVDKATK